MHHQSVYIHFYKRWTRQGSHLPCRIFDLQVILRNMRVSQDHLLCSSYKLQKNFYWDLEFYMILGIIFLFKFVLRLSFIFPFFLYFSWCLLQVAPLMCDMCSLILILLWGILDDTGFTCLRVLIRSSARVFFFVKLRFKILEENFCTKVI